MDASGASGGDAANAGFVINDSGVSVIAFGFQNEFIPAGDGTLVTLNAANLPTVL